MMLSLFKASLWQTLIHTQLYSPALDPINNWDPWGLDSKGTADEVKEFALGVAEGLWEQKRDQIKGLTDTLIECARMPRVCADLPGGIKQMGKDLAQQGRDAKDEANGAIECIQDEACRGGVPKAAQDDAKRQVEDFNKKTNREKGNMVGRAVGEAVDDALTKHAGKIARTLPGPFGNGSYRKNKKEQKAARAKRNRAENQRKHRRKLSAEKKKRAEADAKAKAKAAETSVDPTKPVVSVQVVMKTGWITDQCPGPIS